MKDQVHGYGEVRAAVYDEDSLSNKGNREEHRFYLEAILRYFDSKRVSRFIELGCGTGYYTDLFYDVYPEIQGVILDGSEEMLRLAVEKMEKIGNFPAAICRLFEDFEPALDCPGEYDIAFSCLAIHHLPDESKGDMFRKIGSCLRAGGIFVLYDLFKCGSAQSDRLLEYLSCKDIQRKLKAELDIGIEIEDLSIDNIIRSDRDARRREGDQEATLEMQIAALRDAGFCSVTIFYQEARFFGLVAVK